MSNNCESRYFVILRCNVKDVGRDDGDDVGKDVGIEVGMLVGLFEGSLVGDPSPPPLADGSV